MPYLLKVLTFAFLILPVIAALSVLSESILMDGVVRREEEFSRLGAADSLAELIIFLLANLLAPVAAIVALKKRQLLIVLMPSAFILSAGLTPFALAIVRENHDIYMQQFPSYLVFSGLIFLYLILSKDVKGYLGKEG